MKREIETIKCECGTVFQWQPSEWENTVELINKFRPELCKVCSDKEYERVQEERKKIKADELAVEYRKDTLSLLPDLFQRTDINHSRFNLSAWLKAKDWEATEERPWLGLIGDTGTCKTRIASLLAIEEMERLARKFIEVRGGCYLDGYNFVFTTGYEITELASIVQTGSFHEKEEARKRLNKIRDADLLLIDDLGKGKLNEATASTLFGVIDHRYANLLRTIWTANSTPEQIAAPMNPDMAAPFAGRLNDHSRILKLKSNA